MKKTKRNAGWKIVSVRVASCEKDHLLSAARVKGLSLSSYISQTALSQASQELRHSPDSAAVTHALRRRGPPGYEGKGWKMIQGARVLLSRRFGPDDLDLRMEWLAEALSKKDRLEVWTWLERWLPNEVRRIPDRRQNSFLKGIFAASDDGLIQ